MNEREGQTSGFEINNEKIFRSIPKYVYEMSKFRSSTFKDLANSGLDIKTQANAESLLNDYYNFSVDGIMYRIVALSVMEPGFPKTTVNERAGITLFFPMFKKIDDIIDNPNFPKFESPQDMSNFLKAQKINIGKSNLSFSIQELIDISLQLLNEEQKEVANEFFSSAAKAHWEYSNKGQPGKYGFEEAHDYKQRTTVDGIRAARKMLGLEDYGDSPMLAGQMIDDALDLVTDARTNTLNLWVGIANDEGELDVILDNLAQKPEGNDLIKGYGLRRKMPRTRRRYMEILTRENESKRSSSAKKFNKALSLLI